MKMFMATFFGICKVYSSKELAEKSIAVYIKNNFLNDSNDSNDSTDWKDVNLRRLFHECFRREHYEQAIVCWNDLVQRQGLFFAEIREIEIDTPFRLDNRF